jgi:hypothetical protein
MEGMQCFIQSGVSNLDNSAVCPSIRFFKLKRRIKIVELLLEDIVPERACRREELVDAKRSAQALLAALVLDNSHVVVEAIAFESRFNAQEIALSGEGI